MDASYRERRSSARRSAIMPLSRRGICDRRRAARRILLMMSSPGSPIAGWKRRLLTEPAVHFFALGALLFLAHRLFVGAPRTVVVTPGVKAELSRRYQDANGRPPSDAELRAEVSKWKIDEA